MPHHPPPPRSDEQVRREQVAAEVSDVILTIEHALSRAKKAHVIVGRQQADSNAELAIADAVKVLDRLRKRLMQDTYYASDDRLL